MVNFLKVFDVPVHVGALWASRDAARSCPRGDIHLAFCQDCSFIANLAFDPERLAYNQPYDNSLDFSAVFRDYAHSLAQALVDRYSLFEKDVVEIGSGHGDFLRLICELGSNRGVGFDPSYEGGAGESEDRLPVRFIKDYYSEKYAALPVDFIYSRHVFEHIHRPVEFLSTLRRTIGSRPATPVFFEVPNAANIFENLYFWDIIYEHCSYFSAASLERAFTVSGFEVLQVKKFYQDQFLGIEAGLGDRSTGAEGAPHPDLPAYARSIAAFGDHFNGKVSKWQGLLRDIHAAARRAVVWGAGAKGIGFLNMLKIDEGIQYVVDINPRKHGKYMAGTGQQIVPPEFLKDYRPDVIIIMNPIYKEEINRQVSDLGLPAPTYLLA
jgi:SAM-dependent methyltransferase